MKDVEKRAEQLRKEGKSRREASSQAYREAVAAKDREHREQGRRESGGSKSGWGL